MKRVLCGRIMLAVMLVAGFASCALAQSDFIPKLKAAAGYSDLHIPFYRPGWQGGSHYPGLWADLEWNPVRWFGIENYASRHGLPDDVVLITNIPGAKIIPVRLAHGHIIPYAEAGFGIGYYGETYSGFFASTTVHNIFVAGRYGFGTDLPMNRLWGLRLDASRMALNFRSWTPIWNISGGVVIPIY